MSQAKVEKRKYEKKNRAAIMRKQKRHKIIGWCIFGFAIGCILAATLGVKIYEAIPKYVEAEKLDAYVSEVWAEGGYGSEYFPNSGDDTTSDTASDTDAEDDEATDDTAEATEAEDTSSEEATEAEDDTSAE